MLNFIRVKPSIFISFFCDFVICYNHFYFYFFATIADTNVITMCGAQQKKLKWKKENWNIWFCKKKTQTVAVTSLLSIIEFLLLFFFLYLCFKKNWIFSLLIGSWNSVEIFSIIINATSIFLYRFVIFVTSFSLGKKIATITTITTIIIL